MPDLAITTSQATTHHFISEVTYEIHEKRKEDFHVKIWIHEFAVKDN